MDLFVLESFGIAISRTQICWNIRARECCSRAKHALFSQCLVKLQPWIKMIQGRPSTFLWWNVLWKHVVHFRTNRGTTEFQHAPFTVQALYMKINQIRVQTWLHIAICKGRHEYLKLLVVRNTGLCQHLSLPSHRSWVNIVQYRTSLLQYFICTRGTSRLPLSVKIETLYIHKYMRHADMNEYNTIWNLDQDLPRSLFLSRRISIRHSPLAKQIISTSHRPAKWSNPCRLSASSSRPRSRLQWAHPRAQNDCRSHPFRSRKTWVTKDVNTSCPLRCLPAIFCWSCSRSQKQSAMSWVLETPRHWDIGIHWLSLQSHEFKDNQEIKKNNWWVTVGLVEKLFF